MPLLQPMLISLIFDLVSQIPAQLGFGTFQSSADGAFMYAPVLGDFRDGPLLKIVGEQCFPLQ